MPGLGNDLVVNLAGNNSKLKSKIAESKGGLSSFASAAKGMLNPVVAGLTAVAGGAIAAGVAVYGLTTRIAGLAAVADQATQTGLSGAFIQRLGYAADQSGVSVETLMGGIKKLTIAIGKGDDKPFAALGISLKEMQALNPEQQFLKVAAAISKLPTAAERAAAAVKIFGKSGIDMTGLFAGGMSDLNALMADAQALGIGISPEGLAKAAAADDAIQRMKASFGALLDQIAVGVAPAFKSIADYITEWIPPITKFFDKFNGMDGKVKFITDLIDTSMEVAFLSVIDHWDEMLKAMVNKTTIAAAKMAWDLSPAGMAVNAAKWGAGKIGLGGGDGAAKGNPGLDAAKARMAEVLGRLDAPQFQPQLLPQKPPAETGAGLSSLASSVAGSASSLFDNAALAAQSTFTDLKIKGGFLVSVVENMFTGGGTGMKAAKEDNMANDNKQETRFAGAMQKGSAEAYSTIVQSMFRGKDPNVQATEKQTMQLVKTMKDTKPKFSMVGAFS